jgi:hypothetical protein
MNIDIICANSPQAKGRVERAFGTLQDRLVKALRLAGMMHKHRDRLFSPPSPVENSLEEFQRQESAHYTQSQGAGHQCQTPLDKYPHRVAKKM